MANPNPISKIPSYYKMALLGAQPADFPAIIAWIERNVSAASGKPLPPDKVKALTDFAQFLENFYLKNPQFAKIFQFWGKHYIGIPVSKSVLNFIITQPDYILHLPFIFGKYAFFQGFLSPKWELKYKPALLDRVIGIPGLGNVVGFLYKRDSWGVYQGPLDRLKDNIKKKIIRRGIRFVGKNLWRLGRKLGIKPLQRLGAKIFATTLLGGLGGTFFAVYPLFKDTLKKIAKVFGATWLGLLVWAAQYGTAALVGFGLGTVTGAVAGIKVGSIVFGATAGALGPFAIIPAVLAGGLTWLGITGAFTGLAILFSKFINGIIAGASSALSSLAGTGAEMAAGPGLGVGFSLNLTGAAAPVLGITGATLTGLFFYTQLVNTSSLMTPPGLEFAAGSQYIEIQKGVQVNTSLDNQEGFKDQYALPNSVTNGGFKAFYQISIKVTKDLTNLEITDNSNRTNKDGSQKVREKSWSVAKLANGESWSSEVYSFDLNANFKDSFVSNTVTVKTAEGEEKSTTLSFKIGNPPIPPLAESAILLAEKLINCYGSYLTRSTFKDNGACLEKNGISQATINEVKRSVLGYGRFQCVGFVSAATTYANQPIPIGIGDANAYFGHKVGNYYWHSNKEIEKIRAGDIFVSNEGSSGHIAIITEVNANGFRLTEALGDSGRVHVHNGHFITFEQAKKRQIGFLRYGE